MIKPFPSVEALNTHLADKSYVMGFSFSAGDVQTFKQFPVPDKATLPHAYRWYIHIAALQGMPAAMAAMSSAGPSAKTKAAAPAKKAAKPAAAEEEDDDEFDFGDDDEEEEEKAEPANDRKAKAAALKAKRDAETEEKKKIAMERLAKKEAKQRSLCNLEVKPWEEEQDLMELFAKIKSTVVKPGLAWGENCSLKPVAYGIKKICMTAVINMDISMDEVIEEILEDVFPDEIQSMEMLNMSLL